MPRKIKVVDIPTEAFETAREEDVKRRNKRRNKRRSKRRLHRY